MLHLPSTKMHLEDKHWEYCCTKSIRVEEHLPQLLCHLILSISATEVSEINTLIEVTQLLCHLVSCLHGCITKDSLVLTVHQNFNLRYGLRQSLYSTSSTTNQGDTTTEGTMFALKSHNTCTEGQMKAE